MSPSRWRIAVVVPPIVAIGGLLVALAMPGHGSGSISRFVVPFQFGPLVGLTSVAAAWAVFGPGRWIVRLPLSLAWVSLLVVALFANHCRLFRQVHIDFALLPLLGLLSQWLLVQMLFWIPARIYGLRMVHESDLENNSATFDRTAETRRRPQFGVGHLMIFTTFVAMALGVLRVIAVANIMQRGELLLACTLVVGAIVITLPLFIAAIPGRGWTVVAVVALSIIAVILSSEFGLSQAIGLRNRLPNDWHCVWLYAHTAFWVLLPVCAARMSGYLITIQPRIESMVKGASPVVNLDSPPASASRPQLPASELPSPWATGD
jgi:hypothetical protein